MMKNIIGKVLNTVRTVNEYRKLPSHVKDNYRSDYWCTHNDDPGIDKAIDEGIEWLCRAQDHSTTKDGGVARHFSILTGWGPSYPETTGYIIPTLISYSKLRGDETASSKTIKMIDWLVSIQLPKFVYTKYA